MTKENAYQKLEDMVCNRNLGLLEIEKTTSSFLDFWKNGGIHKAVEKNGWVSVRKMAEKNGVQETVLEIMDILFQPEKGDERDV